MSDAQDFFKYSRGYTLYTQGETDVGRLSARGRDSRGKSIEVDAPIQEREQAAIERDTLLIARAVGTNLSMDEYREIHDLVEWLQSKYAQGELTQAAYQEKLWALPDQFSKRSKDASVHFRPNRDAKGRPTNKPSSLPTEKLKSLKQTVGNDLPKIDFGEFWSGVLERAGVAPVPPGHGSVPTMQGAPPRAGESPKVPNSGQRPLGFLDRIQAGLDAVGAAEPTPVADGTNAVISLVRAVTNPSRASEHIRNAGISAVSAAVPYLGDTLKLGKYAKAFGGSGGGGNILSRLLGAAGGGGIPPGSSGGAAGAAGAGGGALAGVTQGLGRFAAILGPVGIATAAAVVGLRKLVGWIKSIDDSSNRLLERNRSLVAYNGQLAGAYAKLENARLIRDIERAAEMAGPVSRLAENRSNYEQAKEELFIPWQKARTEMIAYMTRGLEVVTKLVDQNDFIGDLLDKIYQDEKEGKETENILGKLQNDAMERMRKRRV